ncbi:MAG TPA: 2-C-methyl-D-erythritol 4-phosphate cytidylyltransferase [Kineosporiaceae bacterium]|nr:2-C-methyl-D-erythritol 4-phosphate cytidylyltransferase [Kineosporiaceae bacterium]
MNTAVDTDDGRPHQGAAIAVVPVCHDDREAPAGCAALRDLRGRSLLVRAVRALLRSGVVGEVAVVVPPDLVPLVKDLVASAGPAGPVRAVILPSEENGHGYRVRVALREHLFPPGTPVVVHDPLFSLAPAELVRSVVQALTEAGPCPRPGAPDLAAIPVRPVTDTLKWVAEDDVVLGTADRDHFRMVSSPQAYWPQQLLSRLEAATDEQLRACGAEVLPGLVRGAGGRLLTVPAPGESFRLATAEDLVLAEAMLHVGTGGEAATRH